MRYEAKFMYLETGNQYAVYDTRDNRFVEVVGGEQAARDEAAKWNKQYAADEKRISKMRKRGDFSY